MPPHHAPLLARKLFAARTAVHAAFSDVDFVQVSASHHMEAVNARNLLLGGFNRLNTSAGAGPVTGNAQRLDAYVSQYSRTVIAGLLSNAAATSNSYLTERLSRISMRYGSLDCGACAGRVQTGRPPCRAHHSDDVVVAQRGECIREIHSVFEWARDFTAQAYEHALLKSAGSMGASVASTLSTSANPQKILRASTRYESLPGLPSVIDLDFPEEAMEADLAAMPYVLVHEFVSHAYFASLSPALRSIRSGYDEWAEAWMDCVAFSLLRDHIDRRKRVSGAGSSFNRNALKDATTDRHVARYGIAAAPPPFGNILREARARYEALEGRVLRFLGTRGRNALLSSMLVLNAFGAPADVTDTLLALTCFRQADAEDLDHLSAAEKRAITALMRFRDHHDTVELGAELLI